MKKGEVWTAPAFLRGLSLTRWRVELLGGRNAKGNVPVRWLDGLLKGREARLEARTLERA